jgi:hypothetical protein
MVKRNNRFMPGDQPRKAKPKPKPKAKPKAKPFVMGDTGVTVRKRKPTPVAPVTRAMKTAAGPPKRTPKAKVKRANPAETTPQFTRGQIDKARIKEWETEMRTLWKRLYGTKK